MQHRDRETDQSGYIADTAFAIPPDQLQHRIAIGIFQEEEIHFETGIDGIYYQHQYEDDEDRSPESAV